MCGPATGADATCWPPDEPPAAAASGGCVAPAAAGLATLTAGGRADRFAAAAGAAGAAGSYCGEVDE